MSPPTKLGGSGEIFPQRMLIHGGGSIMGFTAMMLLKNRCHSSGLCMHDTGRVQISVSLEKSWL